MIQESKTLGRQSRLCPVSGLAIALCKGGTLTHEQVVGIWYIAADAEQFHQIVELAVNVTAYLDTVISPSLQL